MKTLPGLTAFSSITKIIIVILVSSFSVNAQSITGKWKITAVKETMTYRATETQQDMTKELEKITKDLEQVVEFRSDNSYVTTIKKKGANAGFELAGTYSISGNQLNLNPGKTKGTVITNSKFISNPLSSRLSGKMIIVSQAGNTLVLHYGSERTINGKTIDIDIEDSFQKL